MSRDAQKTPGVIGPNAILQFLPVLDAFSGQERRAELLAEAGISDLPDGKTMIPETDAARLHRHLRQTEPEAAPILAVRAGVETANYILRHRIPRSAQLVLRRLPKGPAARLLSRAIAQHAWTFVGSGQFDVKDPWTFEILGNPLIKGEKSPRCLCSWHAGVFSRLYQSLVTRNCFCVETCCHAQHPDNACRFEVRLPTSNNRCAL